MSTAASRKLPRRAAGRATPDDARKLKSVLKTGFCYSAFDLNIRSFLALPELPAQRFRTEDVLIERASLTLPKRLSVNYQFRDYLLKINPTKALLYWKNEASIEVSMGKHIRVDAVKTLDPEILRHLIVGPALSILLEQKGYLVFHAAALAKNREVILLVGASGNGKSTLAFAFHQKGYRFISDNMVVINAKKNYRVYQGLNQIKLWPDAISHFSLPQKKMTLVETDSTKRYLHLKHKPLNSPLLLKKIYTLSRAKKVSVGTLTKQSALTQLIRHSYGTLGLKKNANLSDHFLSLAKLAHRFPISQLKRGNSLSHLDTVIDTVENDLRSHPKTLLSKRDGL